MQNKESKEAANRKDDAVRKIYRKDQCHLDKHFVC